MSVLVCLRLCLRGHIFHFFTLDTAFSSPSRHLDVQPAAKEDGWDTDPFVLTEKDGKLFGRGSSDDKGPALSWLWVIEAHKELGLELPVNIKLMYEGLEEFGSEG